MRQSGEQSEKKTGGRILLRILDKYIPSEDRDLAAFIKEMVVLWRVGKVLCVVAGMFVIYGAAQIVGTAYEAVPPIVFKGLVEAVSRFIPVFLDLMIASLKYLWQPILLYVLIAILTKSDLWRKFWCLVGLAGFFLLFVSALKEFNWPVLGEFSWSAIKEFSSSLKTFNWEEFRILPLLLMQGYLFALWLLPREVWNIVGLIISSVFGLIILISPFDLPTAFDDFGMFGAILAFFLGYLNALASLLQRIVRRL